MKATCEPSDRYEIRRIEGWTVVVNAAFLARQSALAKETLTLLRKNFAGLRAAFLARPSRSFARFAFGSRKKSLTTCAWPIIPTPGG